MVTEYYRVAALDEDLGALGFHVVGYGCTTCIGNSGPLPDEIDAAIDEGELIVGSVLSGNRNFEGRVHPKVKASYLASPPLVVAYALAGTLDWDPECEPIGMGVDGPVMLADVWPSPEEIAEVRGLITPKMFLERYADAVSEPRWDAIASPSEARYAWQDDSTYIRLPTFFEGLDPEPGAIQPIVGARTLLHLGDSVTTDHISPAGAIPHDGPAGVYLRAHGVEPSSLQFLRKSPRQPRGHGARDLRERSHSKPPRSRHGGRMDHTSPDGRGPSDL